MRTRRGLTVEEVLGPQGLAARALPGWDPRAAQVEMAQAILSGIEEGGVLAIEAPTGVGKTLAYLVPALLSGRRVVISTHTKTLQDQIVDKDLPRLAELLRPAGIRLERASPDDDQEVLRPESEPAFALMKGRANYLCLDRLDRKRRQRSLDLGGEASLLDTIARWAERTPRGDRAELAVLPERTSLWGELDARAEICTGTRCARYGDCFVLRMRREAQAAEIVVVNHHLLLADAALRAQFRLENEGRGFGEVIPRADALIIDEAHALEEIAADYFGGSVSTRKLEALAKDLSVFLGTPEAGSGQARLNLDLALARAVGAAQAVFAELPRVEGRLRVERPGSPAIQAARARAEEARPALLLLAGALEEAASASATASALSLRLKDLASAMEFVLEAADPDYVYFSERSGAHANLAASPIHVARLLAEHLFPSYATVVMTSATLAAGDAGCRYFLEAVGAPGSTRAMVLPTPFDYPRQAALYLPRDAPDPDFPDAPLALARIGQELIDEVGGGALFLFTSHRMMRRVHDLLRPSLRFPAMLQGERPQRELLRAFVEQAPAVLFATASFWEGVDVPGDPLRLVLIDRLPFGSPADPLLQARAERLERLGESAFSRLFVPRAILRLKQGFGRLIRGRGDRGVVAILDRRVQTRGYGRLFLRALPEATVVHDPGQLRKWLDDPHRDARGGGDGADLGF